MPVEHAGRQHRRRLRAGGMPGWRQASPDSRLSAKAFPGACPPTNADTFVKECAILHALTNHAAAGEGPTFVDECLPAGIDVTAAKAPRQWLVHWLLLSNGVERSSSAPLGPTQASTCEYAAAEGSMRGAAMLTPVSARTGRAAELSASVAPAARAISSIRAAGIMMRPVTCAWHSLLPLHRIIVCTSH